MSPQQKTLSNLTFQPLHFKPCCSTRILLLISGWRAPGFRNMSVQSICDIFFQTGRYTGRKFDIDRCNTTLLNERYLLAYQSGREWHSAARQRRRQRIINIAVLVFKGIRIAQHAFALTAVCYRLIVLGRRDRSHTGIIELVVRRH